jgi:hypothetical protein
MNNTKSLKDFFSIGCQSEKYQTTWQMEGLTHNMPNQFRPVIWAKQAPYRAGGRAPEEQGQA